MISIKIKNGDVKQVSLDGLMSFGKTENGQLVMDFLSCSDVEMEPFRGDFRVQGMHDGSVYMSQLPRRTRNEAIFRDDNCSLSLGQNDRYYFVFTLPKDRLRDLPRELLRQAWAIVQKVKRGLIEINN